jgi:mono/diheme cytochrome c family protein
MKTLILSTMVAVGVALVTPMRATAEDGAAVYKTQCAKCHGATGEADTPAAKTLKAPKLAGDAKVAAMSVEDLVKAIKGNAKHKSFVAKMTDEQVSAAAGHAKQLAGGK